MLPIGFGRLALLHEIHYLLRRYILLQFSQLRILRYFHIEPDRDGAHERNQLLTACWASRLTCRSRSARFAARSPIRFCVMRTKVERKMALHRGDHRENNKVGIEFRERSPGEIADDPSDNHDKLEQN